MNTAFYRILAPNGMSCVKVLKFQIIAKETLDAAGLQVSEVEADASKQVFSGFQLDHKPGVVSLEVSHLAVATWSEHAARQRRLTGDQDHVELQAASSCLVSHQCWVSFCTYRWTPKRTVVACRCARVPMDGVIASTSLFQPCKFLVAVGLCYRCLGWNTWELGSHEPLV